MLLAAGSSIESKVVGMKTEMLRLIHLFDLAVCNVSVHSGCITEDPAFEEKYRLEPGENTVPIIFV